MNNCNNYKKIVHCVLWFGNKIALSKRLKPGYHKNFWSDPGGKVEDDENIIDAAVRELYEETGMYLNPTRFELDDCYIYNKRKLKTFLFVAFLTRFDFKLMKNPEPDKQSDWELFSIKEALKLKLIPSVQFYLESINK